MTTFAAAVSAPAALDRGYTRTENGMRSLKSTLNANLDLFGSITRGRNLVPAFDAAYRENPDVALRVLQYARDVRGGQGERKIYRDILLHIERTNPALLIESHLLDNVAEIGRYDDLLIFVTDEVKAKAYAVFTKALSEKNGLAAKWAPRKGQVAAELRSFMGLTPKQYRKLVVRLTNVVETQMCANNWNEINFSHVPSVAMSRYLTAFHTKAGDRFSAYREALKRPDAKEKGVKVNAAALYPHQIVQMVGGAMDYNGYNRSSYHNHRDMDMAQAMWDALPDFMNDTSVLPMVDTSGSMTCNYYGGSVRPLDVAVSLGIYTSSKTKNAAFRDLILSFSNRPKLQKVSGSLADRLTAMSKVPWDGNTNLHAAFDEILNVALRNNVPDSEMPGTLLIFSDMQFDGCVRYDDSALQMMRRKYEAAGYTMPRVVFWNLNDRGDKPVRFNEKGVALVAGFSPSVMKSVLASDLDNFTPENVMLATVMKDRYNW